MDMSTAIGQIHQWALAWHKAGKIYNDPQTSSTKQRAQKENHIYSWAAFRACCDRSLWIVMGLTCEHRRGSSGHDGHHKQVFHLGLHHDEVLVISQGVGSKAHNVLTAHPRCNNTTLTRKSPCKQIWKSTPSDFRQTQFSLILHVWYCRWCWCSHTGLQHQHSNAY